MPRASPSRRHWREPERPPARVAAPRAVSCDVRGDRFSGRGRCGHRWSGVVLVFERGVGRRMDEVCRQGDQDERQREQAEVPLRVHRPSAHSEMRPTVTHGAAPRGIATARSPRRPPWRSPPARAFLDWNVAAVYPRGADGEHASGRWVASAMGPAVIIWGCRFGREGCTARRSPRDRHIRNRSTPDWQRTEKNARHRVRRARLSAPAAKQSVPTARRQICRTARASTGA